MLTRRSRSGRSSTRVGVSRGASRSILSLVGLGVPLFVLAQALTSCGSDDSDGASCKAGELKACAVVGNSCEGVQTCTSDGSGYSPCACPGSNGTAGSAGAGGGGGGSAGASGAAGAAGAGPIGGASVFAGDDRAVGSPCTTDAECPRGPNGEAPLTCIRSTDTAEFGQGGPQGGYCSTVCQTSDQCDAIDPLSACGLIDDATGNGICVSLCSPGDPAVAPIKCTESTGVPRAQACLSASQDDSIGVCLPVCQSDAACGAGLFCNLGVGTIGLCTVTPPVGGDVGAPCTTETEATDCKSGLCLTLLDDAGDPSGSFCSAVCSFGLLAGCGFDATTATPRDAVCLQPQLDGGDIGDFGICFELCDTAADCAQEGWTCTPLTPAGQDFVGRVGECLPPTAGGAPDAG